METQSNEEHTQAVVNMNLSPDEVAALALYRKRSKILGRMFKVGSDGFAILVDYMGEEPRVVQSARVSYGDGTKTVSDDETLLRFLLRHRHTTPFEMVKFTFCLRMPIYVIRQWIRHRTANVNEYSGRYSEMIDSIEPCREWRTQSQSNKQGSSDALEPTLLKHLPEWDVQAAANVVKAKKTQLYKSTSSLTGTITQVRWMNSDFTEGHYDLSELDGRWFGDDGSNPNDDLNTGNWPVPEVLTAIEILGHKDVRTEYEMRLAAGVAREQARKDLPVSNYTEFYWTMDCHNLMHFLGLRMDSHAQLEIREFANTIGEIVKTTHPTIWQAFLDYRFNAITFSAPELRMLGARLDGLEFTDPSMSKREIDEFNAKIATIRAATPRALPPENGGS